MKRNRDNPNNNNGGTSRRQAVLYARVSSKEQEKEGFSIPAQLKLLRGYAANSSITIVHEFVDVETAKQAGRSGFGEMVSFLRRNRACRILLVEKTDRLYRNLKDWVTIDDLGLEIHLVKENAVLTHDSRSSEKFMHGIKVLMAKNYIDNLSEETRKGMLEKAEQGIWPSFAPLGYRNVAGPDGKKTIEPDPEVAPLISHLFEWYVTGNYSVREVAKMARDAGMVFRKSRNPVPHATVHNILRNRIYTGDFDWNEQTYHGVHTGLVTRDLWNQAQAILDGRFAKRRRRAKHDFAFSGLITCGHCGCSLVAEIKKGRYVYYHCTGFKGKCPEPYTREEVLEEQFAAILKDLTFDREVMDWVASALRQSHKDEKKYHDDAVIRLQTEYNRLQDRIDAMYIDRLDGRVDVAFFDRKATEWREEQDRLLHAIEKHQAANQNYLEEGVQLLELASRAHELFESQEPREKRRLLDFVLSNCSWRDGELSVTYRQPFDLFVKTGLSARQGAETAIAGGDSSDSFDNWLPEFVSQSVIRLSFPLRLASLFCWSRRQTAARRTIQDLATYWHALLESGAAPNRAALARLQGVSRARVTQVLGVAPT
jgi:site-specific DNA recombinase